MKQYNYKVVGVTFPARDGSDRQKTLRELWNEDVELDNSSHAVKLEGYEFEGEGALAVLLDGKEVGNIPADKVQDVAEIGQKADACEVTLTLNGRDFEDAQDIIDTYKNRNQYVKDGIIHELELDDVEEAYHELMSGEKIYGAVLHFQILDQEEREDQKRIREEAKARMEEEAKPKPKAPIRPLFLILAILSGIVGFVLGIGTIAEGFTPGITIAFLIFAAAFVFSLINIRRPKK